MASSQISPLNIDNICGLKSVNNSQVYFEPYQKMINVRQNLVEPRPGQAELRWVQTCNGHIPRLRPTIGAQCSAVHVTFNAGLE